MRRLFFALWPDVRIRQQLQILAAALPLSSGQLVIPENWHVTLAFIGNIEDVLLPQVRCDARLNNTQPFTLVFDRLEYWQESGVLCLTCSYVDAATRLAEDLSISLRALGIKLDTRPYRPHLTLARNVSAKPEVTFTPLRWCATEFALVESVSESFGSVYKPLQFWHL